MLMIILKAAELSKAEKKAAVPGLLQKFIRHRPRFVCFVGKVIWDVVEPVLKENASAIPKPIAPLPSLGCPIGDDDAAERAGTSRSTSPTNKKSGGKAKSTKGQVKSNCKKPPFPYHLPLPYKLVHDPAPDVRLLEPTASQLLTSLLVVRGA